MKYYNVLLIIKILSLPSLTIHCMQLPPQSEAIVLYKKHFNHLGTIAKGAFSPHNHHIIITSLKKCYTLNYLNHKIMSFFEYNKHELINSIHINSTKNLFATEGLSLKIFDLNTKKIIWDKNISPKESAMGFSSTKPNIFYTRQSNLITENNFVTNTEKTFLLLKDNTLHLHQHSISAHQSKNIFFLWKKCPLFSVNIKTFCPTDINYIQNLYTFPKTKQYDICQCLHIKDNYLMIIEKCNKIFIINTATKTIENLPVQYSQPNAFESSSTVLCLPDSYIVAMFFDNNRTINFWNVKTKKCVCILSLNHLLKDQLSNNMGHFKLLNFSLNGEKLLISFEQTCFIIQIPLHARYERKIKKICMFIYCASHYFIDHDKKPIPLDIRNLIASTVLLLGKY